VSSRAASVLLALGLIAQPVAAQVSGTVLDDRGKPVPGALVEIWSPTRRLAGTVSGPEGQFKFGTSVSRGVAGVLVRAVGYGMLRASVADGDTTMSVQLSFLTTKVTPLVVTGHRSACDNPDEPAARALWQTASRRYDLSVLAWAVEDTVRIVASRVTPERLGVVDTAAWTLGMLGWSADFYRVQTARIRDHGYAVRFDGFGRPWYDAWDYAALESNLAAHFVDSLFARLHKISVSRAGPGGVELRFCPRRREAPHIDGTMLLGPDASLVKAAWHFYTPEPDEYAGGEVAFAPLPPASSTAPRLLMAITGFFYRRGVRDFYQVWLDHRHWYVCRTERLERCREAEGP